MLVRVVMKQIAITRDETGCGGLVVVGADHGRRLGVICECLYKTCNMVRRQQHIRVCKDHDMARRCSDSGISCGGNTGRVRVADNAETMGICRFEHCRIRAV